MTQTQHTPDKTLKILVRIYKDAYKIGLANAKEDARLTIIERTGLQAGTPDWLKKVEAIANFFSDRPRG